MKMISLLMIREIKLMTKIKPKIRAKIIEIIPKRAKIHKILN